MSMREVIESIDHEMFNRATKRTCGNCKWYAEFEGVCFNGDSEKRADFTDKDFCCGCHEFKVDMKNE